MFGRGNFIRAVPINSRRLFFIVFFRRFPERVLGIKNYYIILYYM